MVAVNINDLINCVCCLAFLGLQGGPQIRLLGVHTWLALLSELGTDSHRSFEAFLNIQWSDLEFFLSDTLSGWEGVGVELSSPDTGQRMKSLVSSRRSTNKSAAFFLLIAGLLNGVFEDVQNYDDVIKLIFEDMNSFRGLKLVIKKSCLAKRVFVANNQPTKNLLSTAVQRVTGYCEDFQVIEGPSPERGPLRRFYDWEAKQVVFNRMVLDICFLSTPSNDVFKALLQYYGHQHGLLQYYRMEEPNAGLRCPFCGENEPVPKQNNILHTHSHARERVCSFSENFLPTPSTCTFMLNAATANSVDYRCNRRLTWDSPAEISKSRNHIQDHITVHGTVCRWDACVTRLEGKVEANICCVSRAHLDLHIESMHLYSFRERDAIYCYFCTVWLPQGPEAELHLLTHKDEIKQSIQDVGFKGVKCLYSKFRMLKPWLCPFCYISGQLVPSKQYKQYGDDSTYFRHMRTHIKALDMIKSHNCPVYIAKHCEDESLMTPSDLNLHLKAAHGLLR